MKPAKLVVEKLANGIIELNSIPFPEKVMSIAKELIVDVSGAILAGSCTDSMHSIFDVASEIYSSGNCNVIGRKKSFNPSPHPIETLKNRSRLRGNLKKPIAIS